MKKPDWLVVSEEIMAGYTWKNIFTLLWMNKFRVHPKYWIRLGYAFLLATFTTPMRIISKFKGRRMVKKTNMKHDPVFIIGNYRTGTTYLITMLSKDKSRGYVSNLLGYTFSMFLAIPKLARRIIDASLPEYRPMDNVKMGADEPTEDEYCLGTYSKYGYYNGMVFPQNFPKFARYHSFDGLPKDAKKWQKQYDYLIKVLTSIYDGRQLFLKNPAVAFRIKMILEMYPNAKFIFTYRNPYTLYASNLNYYKKVVPLYTLQNYSEDILKEEILTHYSEMIHKLDEGKKLIPEGNYMDIKYEDFIQDPMPFMERIYKQFKLDGWEEARPAFQAHYDSQATYKTNNFRIANEVIKTVNEYWDFIVEKQGYEPLNVYDERFSQEIAKEVSANSAISSNKADKVPIISKHSED